MSPPEEGRSSGTPTADVPPPQPTAVRAALASLPVGTADDRFWAELEEAVGDESPLRIVPRPAIRPITQPPPREGGGGAVEEDVFERGGQQRIPLSRRLASRTTGSRRGGGGLGGLGSRRSNGWRALLILVALAIAALVAVGLVRGDPDEPSDDTETGGAAQADEKAGDQPDGGAVAESGTEGRGEGEPAAAAAPTTTTTTTPVPEGLGADAVLTASGIGPLTTGQVRLRDLAAATGADPAVDEGTFRGSGGTCYEARLPGASDVTLWVRAGQDAPDGLEDPLDGILSSVSIALHPGSDRVTDAGIGLGANELALIDAYQGTLSQEPNPYNPTGSIYLAEADDGSGNSIAYVTGGGEVIEIRAGATTVVGRPHPCL